MRVYVCVYTRTRGSLQHQYSFPLSRVSVCPSTKAIYPAKCIENGSFFFLPSSLFGIIVTSFSIGVNVKRRNATVATTREEEEEGTSAQPPPSPQLLLARVSVSWRQQAPLLLLFLLPFRSFIPLFFLSLFSLLVEL